MKVESITPLPVINSAFQRISRLKQNRLLCIYALILISAITLFAICKQPLWQAFALGLMIPGGSFLMHAGIDNWSGILHFAVFTTILIFFIVSIFLWFATGNILTPPAIWLSSALFGAYSHRHSLPIDNICGQPLFIVKLSCLITSLMLGLLISRKLSTFTQKKRREEANAYLNMCTTNFDTGVKEDHINELSLNDLKLMRFVLDRALQPITAFEGFDWLDQFQTAAVRYQLHFMGYALSMAQHTHLSAFSGYLNTAQENLIHKQKDPRVWGYWQLENTWGNLNKDPNPIKHDNIMYSGFCATQIVMYQASSGNNDNDTVTQFNLRHASGKQFNYDLSTIFSTIAGNFRSAEYDLIPCEPNWVYPLCNIITAAGIKRHNHRDWAEQHTKFRNALEHEFIDASGKFIACRSTLTGLPLPSIGGVMPLAMPCFFLNALTPDIALRQWLLVREKILSTSPNKNTLNKKAFWPIDTGNYQFSRASGYATCALAAQELGDTKVATLCLAALEQDYPAKYESNGMYRPNASVWAHAVELLARSTKQNSFQQLISHQKKGNHTPQISEVPYPAILVAHASFENGYLKAILYPGDTGGIYPIELRNLIPNTAYQCSSLNLEYFQSDSKGNARIHLKVEKRTVVLISRAKELI